jgi:hypothetical protein
MKLNAWILAAALGGVGAGAAHAQGAPPPPPGGQGGLRQICAADLTTFCAGKTGHDSLECLAAVVGKLAPDCKAAVTKAGLTAGPAPVGTPVAPGSTWTLEVREDWLLGHLHRAQDDHLIDDAEAMRANTELASLIDRARQISLRRNRPLTAAETSAQLGRLDALVASIHWLKPDPTLRPW